MKKWAYLFGGFIVGVVVVASGDAVAAQVKSLVGQKVTGEYKVIVNGKELQDKGAVIEGRTNAPVRAISESIGADLKVDNKAKTITITTDDASDLPSSSNGTDADDSKRSLLLLQKKSLEDEIEKLEKVKKHDEEQYNAILEEGLPKEILREAVYSINKQLDEKTQDLNKINAELAALNK